MRCREIVNADRVVLMVLVSEQERQEAGIIKRIDEYKRKYGEIVVFIGGTESVERVFEDTALMDIE